jgi:hypothetical protein
LWRKWCLINGKYCSCVPHVAPAFETQELQLLLSTIRSMISELFKIPSDES